MENQGQLIPTTRLEKDFLCIRLELGYISMIPSPAGLPTAVLSALQLGDFLFHVGTALVKHLGRLHPFD